MHVGFWDEKSENKASTDAIKLQLVSGKSVSKKNYFDQQTPFKKEEKDGRYKASYSFTALSAEKKCVPKTRCSGWNLNGVYEVTTSADGKS